MTYVYAKLTTECVNVKTEETKTLSVIMRFNDRDECDVVADHLFDSALGCFNKGLPAGWVCDESPEIDNFVSEEDAKKIGFVIYHWS